MNGVGLATQYRMRLTQEERTDLEDRVYKGKIAAYKRLYAPICSRPVSAMPVKKGPIVKSVRLWAFQRIPLNALGSVYMKGWRRYSTELYPRAERIIWMVDNLNMHAGDPLHKFFALEAVDAEGDPPIQRR
ncbi:hypothetical protein [Methylomicrobium agile]|uniref:hypothetical protein n=1 Tax=Methylomicrobium agile TaxID=39774 RepID=UPI0012F6EA70|nr:hypothetical protein [Methylomicrobium agile]